MSRPPAPGEIYESRHKWALFLDIDGTLIDVASDPGKVFIPADLPHLLHNLARQLGGALALNTGRELAVVDLMMAPRRLKAAGVHGTELRLAADAEVLSLAPERPQPLLTEVRAEALLLSPNVVVEDKRIGIAVHYRHAPEAETALVALIERIAAQWPDFEIRPGRKVIELLPHGYDKASAIERFLQEPEFCGRLPLVIGDDVGDEPALALARRLGGAAMTVAGEYFSEEAANFTAPASVRAWLAEILKPHAKD